MKCPIAGRGAPDDAASGQQRPFGIAVGATSARRANRDDGTVASCVHGGRRARRRWS
jgi:hypothetical protein